MAQDPTLVTLQEGKAQMRVLTSDFDNEIERKLWEAEQTVLKYIERIDTGWTENSVPGQVKAAILIVATYLFDHRGDEDMGDPLTPAARSLLKMFRDPVFA